MKDLFVWNAAHLLVLATDCTFYFLCIFNFLLNTLAATASDMRLWILSSFSYILCFQELAQSVPVITWQLTYFAANIFKLK